MVDETETELEKLHKRLAELEKKAQPVVINGYLKLKAFLNKYIEKYPVYACWTSGAVSAAAMYMVRKWFQF